jgi:hypothetical protein
MCIMELHAVASAPRSAVALAACATARRLWTCGRDRGQKLTNTLLRTARGRYICNGCGAHIRSGQLYFREEPGIFSRIRGAPPIYKCTVCVTGLRPWELADQRAKEATLRGVEQLHLWSDASPLPPHRVELVDVTQSILEQLRLDHDQIFAISPESLELLVLNRLLAMGYQAERTSSVYRKDGGIDIVFWPTSSGGFPFVGAVQVKHHRSRQTREGPAALRQLVGVASGVVNLGVVVTNTTFTPDALWYARHRPVFLRLRDMHDLRRWIISEFSQERAWRDLPDELEVAPNLRIKIGPSR